MDSGPFCPQDLRLTNRFYSPFHVKSHEMDENCLFLNVWTPTNNPMAKLPVMVWTYGGFFKIGKSVKPKCFCGYKKMEITESLRPMSLSY